MARTAPPSLTSPPNRRQVLKTVRRVLEQTADVLIDVGVSPTELSREFSRICRERRPRSGRSTGSLGLLVSQLGRLLAQWHSDPLYLDGDGEPRALPFAGAGVALNTLIRAAMPDHEPRQILRTLVKTRSVRRRGSRYLPVRRFFSTAEVAPMAHSQSLNSIWGLLQTVQYNVSCTDPTQRLLERQAHNPSIPLRRVPEAHRFLKLESHALLEKADAFLADLEVPPGSEPTTSLHLGVFVHEDPPVKGIRVRKRRAARLRK